MNPVKSCVSLLVGLLLAGLASPLIAQSKNGFDLSNATIPVREIHSGGPPRDGIPAIDEPQFWSISRADTFLRPDDEVVSFVHQGDARAYPLRILVWHEIVNDTVGREPVAITYCPLCGTSMIFGRSFGGEATTLGVSGLLYNSDVLMYDRATDSLWSQLKMVAVSGPRAGTTLDWLASQIMPWQQWKARYPDGKVLSTETGHSRNYSRMPYQGYENTPRTMFPVSGNRDDFSPKTWVAGVIVNSQAHAFELAQLGERGGWEGRIGGREVSVSHKDEAVEVTDVANGETIPHVLAYWFAWQAFYPETAVWPKG